MPVPVMHMVWPSCAVLPDIWGRRGVFLPDNEDGAFRNFGVRCGEVLRPGRRNSEAQRKAERSQ
ncbi:MAG: hypothetical protein CFE35_00230 [Novosphingobium sp. PASSN1]|nr:MAG: hypothetical protein CFE35_00230 [Novosphingobium sp. PASSN1]